jgi:hypothetical protein
MNCMVVSKRRLKFQNIYQGTGLLNAYNLSWGSEYMIILRRDLTTNFLDKVSSEPSNRPTRAAAEADDRALDISN